MFTVVLSDGTRHRVRYHWADLSENVFSVTGISPGNQRFTCGGEEVQFPHAGDVVQLTSTGKEQVCDLLAAAEMVNISALKLLIESEYKNKFRTNICEGVVAEVLSSVLHPFWFTIGISLTSEFSYEVLCEGMEMEEFIQPFISFKHLFILLERGGRSWTKQLLMSIHHDTSECEEVIDAIDASHEGTKLAMAYNLVLARRQKLKNESQDA